VPFIDSTIFKLLNLDFGFVLHIVGALMAFVVLQNNHLQLNSFCVVSGSGTLPEESSYFKSFPAVCIRTSIERPEAIDKGNFIIGSITTEQVLQAMDLAVSMAQNGDVGVDVPDYVDDNVSTKVVKIIQSYTGIVDRMVWRKG
jgi:UDP-N-acetylglucosamine 2-epimerase